MQNYSLPNTHSSLSQNYPTHQPPNMHYATSRNAASLNVSPQLRLPYQHRNLSTLSKLKAVKSKVNLITMKGLDPSKDNSRSNTTMDLYK